MKKTIPFFAAADSGFDTAVHLLCALFAYAPAVRSDFSTLIGTRGFVLLLACLGVTLLDTLLGVYDHACYRRFGMACRAILRAEALVHLTLPVLWISLITAPYPDAPRWILLSCLLDTALLLAKRYALVRLRRVLLMRAHAKSLLIVGDNPRAALRFVKSVESHTEDGYRIVGFVGDALSERELSLSRLGRDEELAAVLDRYHPAAVAFAIRSDSDPRFLKAVSLCDDRVIPVYLLPIVHEYFKTPRQIVPLCGENAIRLHYTPLEERWARVFKRLEDFIFGGILLLLALPWMGAIALAVRLSDGAPVLFRQRRVGERGREFTILKFRTMRDTPERDTAMTARADPRRTRLGKLLRATSLDELPQLINVIRGDMSLVGPRPEIPALVSKFQKSIPLYMLKHYAKPGITGLSQIRGLRGDTSIEERIQEDLRYMAEWTPTLDLKILLWTPLRLINRQELSQRRTVSAQGERGGDLSVLYAASTEQHLLRFHQPILANLKKEGCRAFTLSNGKNSDFSLPFCKRFFSFSNIICIFRVRKLLREHCFDLLVLNTTLASVVLRLALPRKRRCTVVNFVHGYLFCAPPQGIKERLLLFLERHLKKKTDVVLVMNEEDERIARRYALGEQIYATFGCGVVPPSTKIAPTYRRPCARRDADEPFTLGFVGELSDRKNQAFLIRALAALRAYVPNARLVLIGDGAAKGGLMDLAKRLGLSRHVSFLGAKERPWEELLHLDLYVSAARYEGLPFNIVEAALHSLPILASNVKGHRDILKGLDGSALYTPNSIQDFVYHCLHFYYDPPSIDARNTRSSLKKFLFNDATSHLFTVFREVINLCQ